MPLPKSRHADTLIIVDFETTGLSPDQGDRAIEIGAVLIESGEITARFQQLMNPGIPVPLFVENLTGITNAMIKTARSNADVMRDFHEFVADHNIVAHNAAFDTRFLQAEFRRIKKRFDGGVACSLLAARRLFQQAPNHQLATLVKYRNLPAAGQYHRALADAEMTSHLWLNLINEVGKLAELQQIPFHLMVELGKTPKHKLRSFLQAWQAKN